MKMLACDGIHEDGLALFRDAGWIVEISDPIKDSAALSQALAGVNIVNFSLGAKGDGEALAATTVDRAVPAAQLVALRSIPGVLSLETL